MTAPVASFSAIEIRLVVARTVAAVQIASFTPGVSIKITFSVAIAVAALEVWLAIPVARSALKIRIVAALVWAPLEIMVRAAVIARPEIRPSLVAILASKIRPVLARAHLVEIRAIAAHFRPGAIRAVWLCHCIVGHAETQYHCGGQREHCKSFHYISPFIQDCPHILSCRGADC